MNEAVYYDLLNRAGTIGRFFSNEHREHNHTNEKFTVNRVVVLSDHSAIVIYDKSSGLRALAHFIYIPAKRRWLYYFPTDSHFNNLDRLPIVKFEVEQHNAKARNGKSDTHENK